MKSPISPDRIWAEFRQIVKLRETRISGRILRPLLIAVKLFEDVDYEFSWIRWLLCILTRKIATVKNREMIKKLKFAKLCERVIT
jgi:hypothetical protein